MSTVRTPKRKIARRTSGAGSRRSSLSSTGGSAAQRKRRRRSSNKWNVKPNDPDAAHHELGTNVHTTQAPLSKSALKKKYSSSMLTDIDLDHEAQQLLGYPAGKWDAIVESLEHIRAVATAQPTDIVGHEELVFKALMHCIPNSRSAIPRHALNTMNVVLGGAGKFFEASEADAATREKVAGLLHLLLKTSATHDKKFIKAAATRCVTAAVGVAQGKQQFATLFTVPAVLQHRNRNMIAAGVSGYQKCVEQCTAKDLAAWDTVQFAEALHRVFTARSSNARSSSRAIGRFAREKLDIDTVQQLKSLLLPKKEITANDIETIFKAKRQSARKKFTRPRPWAKRR